MTRCSAVKPRNKAFHLKVYVVPVYEQLLFVINFKVNFRSCLKCISFMVVLGDEKMSY